MQVELLDSNTDGGILDLTGGSNVVQAVESTEQPTETVVEETQETTGDGQEVDTGDTSIDNNDSTTSDVADEDSELTEHYFNGEVVQVSVPDDIQTALDDAGVDSKSLMNQLFAKDSDFTLDAGTRAKLDEKFGKLLVDGYLNMFKTTNTQAMDKFNADKQTADQQLLTQQTEYSEAVGGLEGLTQIESFIVDNFDEKQIAAYNAVMDTDNHQAHLLILGQVKSQMDLASKLANGDTKITLVGDKTSSSSEKASPMDKGYLDAAEYQTLIADPKYWEDKEYMARVDHSRIMGKRKGL